MTQPGTGAKQGFSSAFNLKLFALTLILLLAAFGRILNIDHESLWVDEGFSYWAIRHPHMFDLLRNDVHPPVYFVLLRGWAGVAGISELALRYLSVAPGIFSVAAIYHVARELERLRGTDRPGLVPLLAALLLALADMEIYVAQQTRMYTWHVLWVILSMWGFLRWNRTSERRALVGWIASSALLLYTQYVGLAALAVQGLYALLFLRGGQRIRAIGALGLVGLLFLPWLALVVGGQTANVGTGFNVPSTLESLWNYRDEWFTGQWALMLVLALLGLTGWMPTKPLASIPSRSRWGGVGFLLLAWLVVPVAAAYVLNFRTPILIDYRLTQITPAVALLIAFGLGSLRGVALPLLVAVIVMYGVTVNDTPRPRPPWRAVGQNAARYTQPGDLALAHVTPSGDWQVIYYYERFMPDGVEWRSLRQWQLEQFYGSRYEDGLPHLLAEFDHVWLMHWSSDVSAFGMLASSGHVQTAVMTEDWLGNDLNVYRFDRLVDEGAALAVYDRGLTLREAAVYGDSLRLDLWWSVTEPLDADYTISARLLDANGALVAQHDAGPFNNARPTSGIQPGEVVYDPHPMALVEGIDTLPPGDYTVNLLVYRWTPDAIINQTTLDGTETLEIGIIRQPPS